MSLEKPNHLFYCKFKQVSVIKIAFYRSKDRGSFNFLTKKQ